MVSVVHGLKIIIWVPMGKIIRKKYFWNQRSWKCVQALMHMECGWTDTFTHETQYDNISYHDMAKGWVS